MIEFLDKDLDGHIGFDEFEKYYEQKAAEAAEYQKVQAALGKTVENKLNLGKEVKDIEGEDWESKIVERIFTGQWVEEVDPALPQLVSPTLTHRVGDFVAGGSNFQHVSSVTFFSDVFVNFTKQVSSVTKPVLQLRHQH